MATHVIAQGHATHVIAQGHATRRTVVVFIDGCSFYVMAVTVTIGTNYLTSVTILVVFMMEEYQV